MRATLDHAHVAMFTRRHGTSVCISHRLSPCGLGKKQSSLFCPRHVTRSAPCWGRSPLWDGVSRSHRVPVRPAPPSAVARPRACACMLAHARASSSARGHRLVALLVMLQVSCPGAAAPGSAPTAGSGARAARGRRNGCERGSNHHAITLFCSKHRLALRHVEFTSAVIQGQAQRNHHAARRHLAGRNEPIQ